MVCSVLVCSLSLIPSVHLEGCASWLWHFLCLLTSNLEWHETISQNSTLPKTRPEVIKLFHAQLSLAWNLSLLINMNMATKVAFSYLLAEKFSCSARIFFASSSSLKLISTTSGPNRTIRSENATKILTLERLTVFKLCFYVMVKGLVCWTNVVVVVFFFFFFFLSQDSRVMQTNLTEK